LNWQPFCLKLPSAGITVVPRYIQLGDTFFSRTHVTFNKEDHTLDYKIELKYKSTEIKNTPIDHDGFEVASSNRNKNERIYGNSENIFI
jgi:hypothetical protein